MRCWWRHESRETRFGQNKHQVGQISDSLWSVFSKFYLDHSNYTENCHIFGHMMQIMSSFGHTWHPWHPWLWNYVGVNWLGVYLSCGDQGCQIWHRNWVRLAPNGTNLGLFKISFSTFWRVAPKCTETDLTKSQISPIWGQSDLIWMANLTHPSQTSLINDIFSSEKIPQKMSMMSIYMVRAICWFLASLPSPYLYNHTECVYSLTDYSFFWLVELVDPTT